MTPRGTVLRLDLLSLRLSSNIAEKGLVETFEVVSGFDWLETMSLILLRRKVPGRSVKATLKPTRLLSHLTLPEPEQDETGL